MQRRRHPIPLWALLLLATVLSGCGGTLGSVDGSGQASPLERGSVWLGAGQGALPPGAAAIAVSREDALLASWPAELSLLAAGDFTPSDVVITSPVTLYFTLSRSLEMGTRLSLYQLQGGAWRDTGLQAEVGSDGRTASVSVSRLGQYALFRQAERAALTVDGTRLLYRVDGIPATALRSPAVLAAGETDDPGVVAAVGAVTGMADAQAVEFLRNYDSSGPADVQVMALTTDTYVTRYWGPTGRMGRYLALSSGDALMLPDTARRLLALPDSNNARNVTLYRLKAGTRVVYGVVASQVGNPLFGAYATGGGMQLYVPSATQLVGGQVQLNPAVMEWVDDVRHVQE